MNIMFKAPFQIGMLFPFKDKTPKELRSMVVYKVKCRDCGSFYIGKTSRCLKIRMEEYKKGVGSSIHKHEVGEKHKIDWENVEIMDVATDDHKLLLKEMLHINKNKPSLNVQQQSYVFSMIIGKNEKI